MFDQLFGRLFGPDMGQMVEQAVALGQPCPLCYFQLGVTVVHSPETYRVIKEAS